MNIVSNTSLVVNLYLIGQFEILKILFKEIIIIEDAEKHGIEQLK